MEQLFSEYNWYKDYSSECIQTNELKFNLQIAVEVVCCYLIRILERQFAPCLFRDWNSIFNRLLCLFVGGSTFNLIGDAGRGRHWAKVGGAIGFSVVRIIGA